jgi:hypothetical protein
MGQLVRLILRGALEYRRPEAGPRDRRSGGFTGGSGYS